MFQRRFPSDASARAKKTSPPHRTTIPARIASTHGTQGPGPSFIGMAIASVTTGRVSAALTQNRRFMSVSSGLASDAPEGAIGSSAIPQIGQSPGRSRRTSGCIGQVQPASPCPCALAGAEGCAGRAAPRLASTPT